MANGYARYSGFGGGGGSSAGVSSVNSLTGALTLAAGTGITLTPSGNTITIASTGGGSGTVTSVGLTVPTFLSVTPSTITTSGTFALTLSGTALPIANGGTGSTSQNFVDLTTAQTVAGIKTFSSAPVLSSFATAGVVLNAAGGALSSTAGALPVANGGTAKTSVTAAPAASSWAGWDANKNLSANSVLEGYTTTATAAGTTTLTVASTFLQYFTGATTQTVLLPVTSTLALGQQFQIVNTSSGAVAVQSSGANLVVSIPAGSTAVVTCILITGTTAASWSSFLASNTGVASSVTGSYYSGGFGNAASWSTTSTSFADPTLSGTATLTQNKGSGITITAAAGSLPGITFTPPSTSAVYQVTVTGSFYNGSTGNAAGIRLYDGTTQVATSSMSEVTGLAVSPFTLSGIYAPGVTSAVTLKVQLGASAGTSLIAPQFSGANALEFTLVRIV